MAHANTLDGKQPADAAADSGQREHAHGPNLASSVYDTPYRREAGP
ncbi:hypothetical protein [Bifidobacterium longum]|nr:hypothetical protein [Bifidobacterium longum]MBL3904692.1 hypothetical protein [Bifidobacterium longum subsp. longum]MBL3914129.1 hypothetical protein [Bifidobacterium longum subsp. longum]MDB6753018.1 hypothetical protein [Bifidobacterium longum]MDB6754971.1 hypothetical protein [Bifidobacterium longum]MDB6756795.1 hypothetical protein [Bifidobacterium longum]